MKILRTGFYTVIILGLLKKHGPLYGYKIKSLIKQLSNNTLNPSESTIYETLKNMDKNKLIKSYWTESNLGPPRKYYEITDKGLKTLETLRVELEKIIETINCFNNNFILYGFKRSWARTKL